ncbi:hypothetical protein QYF61_000112 [Mycteria americana]|uniref:RIMB1/RIM3A-C-like N-terminal domain-containing protein n=1 Tax=Mycteria americana TaxID=33587 RepID=A0AAN7P2I6_MYCAM|nr:hypothetical protein QYF61_000112 [Mycteria americana]
MTSGDCWQQRSVANGPLPIPSAMRRDGAGWGLVACSCPLPRRGLAQAPSSPAQKEERWRELEALRPELEGKRLCSHELCRWAGPEGRPGHQGHQKMQSSCSPDGNGPQALAAASHQIKPQVLQERPPERHSTGQQTTWQAVADALLQVPEPGWEDLVLPGSACNQLLEQNARLQHALEDPERQRGALEMHNRLLRRRSSPEACKEAERLQQKNAKLAALTEQLKERCRHLQETIEHLMNTPVPLPIQTSTKDLGMKSFLQQRAGERRESARALLAQDQQNEVSQKAAEKLQAQLAAEEEGSYYMSTLSQKCGELQVQLMEMTDKNTRVAEENSRLRGQMRWAEKVQAENADLKGELTRVAEERNSVIQAIGCLPTQLEDAECKLKAVREMAESAQTEVKRDHEEAMQVFRAQSQLGQRTVFLLSEEDPASEREELVADKQVVVLQALGLKVDEDGWSVGELVDGTRGFIPSNFAEEVSDDDLENKNWNDPRYYMFRLSPILEEDEEDLDNGETSGGQPDEASGHSGGKAKAKFMKSGWKETSKAIGGTSGRHASPRRCEGPPPRCSRGAPRCSRLRQPGRTPELSPEPWSPTEAQDRRIDRNSALESVSQPGNCSLRSRSNTADALADTQPQAADTAHSCPSAQHPSAPGRRPPLLCLPDVAFERDCGIPKGCADGQDNPQTRGKVWSKGDIPLVDEDQVREH